MNLASEALTKLLRTSYILLSDEHLAWDQWCLEWQEHSRTKPNLGHNRAIWAMAKGYFDALDKSKENGGSLPMWERARFRERLSNLAVVSVTYPETDVVKEIETLSKDIDSYFKR
jgi:hypothetical protein